MATTIDNLFTMSEIAKMLAVEPHRLTYLLKTRGIAPAAKKAGIRLYTFKQAQHMAVELGATVPKQVEVDSLPDPAAASNAGPTDASPADCSPQDVGGELIYDPSESQLRTDEDEPPVAGRPQPPLNTAPSRKPRRRSA